MNSELNKWGILYCPKSGIWNSPTKRWEKIAKCLQAEGIEYDYVQSENAGSVDRLVKMLIANGYKTIVIVGGDSALNDAVNCLMQIDRQKREEISLGVIPNGVMNDFALFWDLKEDELEQNIKWLKARRVRKIDLGCIRYTNNKGEKCRRYFLNCINIGLVATIMNLRRQTRRLFGSRTLSDAPENQHRRGEAQGDDRLHRQCPRLRPNAECRALQRLARRVGGLSSANDATFRGNLPLRARKILEPSFRASLSNAKSRSFEGRPRDGWRRWPHDEHARRRVFGWR